MSRSGTDVDESRVSYRQEELSQSEASSSPSCLAGEPTPRGQRQVPRGAAPHCHDVSAPSAERGEGKSSKTHSRTTRRVVKMSSRVKERSTSRPPIAMVQQPVVGDWTMPYACPIDLNKSFIQPMTCSPPLVPHVAACCSYVQPYSPPSPVVLPAIPLHPHGTSLVCSPRSPMLCNRQPQLQPQLWCAHQHVLSPQYLEQPGVVYANGVPRTRTAQLSTAGDFVPLLSVYDENGAQVNVLTDSLGRPILAPPQSQATAAGESVPLTTVYDEHGSPISVMADSYGSPILAQPSSPGKRRVKETPMPASSEKVQATKKLSKIRQQSDEVPSGRASPAAATLKKSGTTITSVAPKKVCDFIRESALKKASSAQGQRAERSVEPQVVVDISASRTSNTSGKIFKDNANFKRSLTPSTVPPLTPETTASRNTFKLEIASASASQERENLENLPAPSFDRPAIQLLNAVTGPQSRRSPSPTNNVLTASRPPSGNRGTGETAEQINQFLTAVLDKSLECLVAPTGRLLPTIEAGSAPPEVTVETITVKAEIHRNSPDSAQRTPGRGQARTPETESPRPLWQPFTKLSRSDHLLGIELSQASATRQDLGNRSRSTQILANMKRYFDDILRDNATVFAELDGDRYDCDWAMVKLIQIAINWLRLLQFWAYGSLMDGAGDRLESHSPGLIEGLSPRLYEIVDEIAPKAKIFDSLVFGGRLTSGTIEYKTTDVVSLKNAVDLLSVCVTEYVISKAQAGLLSGSKPQRSPRPNADSLARWHGYGHLQMDIRAEMAKHLAHHAAKCITSIDKDLKRRSSHPRKSCQTPYGKWPVIKSYSAVHMVLRSMTLTTIAEMFGPCAKIELSKILADKMQGDLPAELLREIESFEQCLNVFFVGDEVTFDCAMSRQLTLPKYSEICRRAREIVTAIIDFVETDK